MARHRISFAPELLAYIKRNEGCDSQTARTALSLSYFHFAQSLHDLKSSVKTSHNGVNNGKKYKLYLTDTVIPVDVPGKKLRTPAELAYQREYQKNVSWPKQKAKLAAERAETQKLAARGPITYTGDILTRWITPPVWPVCNL